MKLHSPKFEAALTARVVTDLQFDPRLEEEYERVRGFKRLKSTLGSFFVSEFGFFTLPFYIGAVLLSDKSGLEDYLFIMSLWLLAWVFSFSLKWDIKRNPNDLEMFNYFPATDEVVYKWELFKVFKASWMCPIYCMFGYWIIAKIFKLGAIMIISFFPLCLMTWLCCLMLSLYVAASSSFRLLWVFIAFLNTLYVIDVASPAQSRSASLRS